MGKQLVLYGGQSRVGGAASDAMGKEVALLNVDTATWERPSIARTIQTSHSHAAVVVGRTKLLVFGGIRGDAACADVGVLNTDTMKWAYPQVKGSERPMPRSGHTTCCIREKVFAFGGSTADGVLLNDVWMYDQDSCQWSHVSTFGSVPSPRRGRYAHPVRVPKCACHADGLCDVHGMRTTFGRVACARSSASCCGRCE